MSWSRVYRLALRLLPPDLRRKHGLAMEALFARELERAREQGRLRTAIAAGASVGDVLVRGAYEHARERPVDGSTEHGEMMEPYQDTRALLGGLARSFVVTFAALTVVFLAMFASRHTANLSSVRVGTEILLLSVPFVAAMTIPMAVLVAVLHALTRPMANIRRSVRPILGAAAGVAVLSLVVTAEIVPRANARLTAVMAGHPTTRGGREMTVSELRSAMRTAAAAGAREDEVSQRRAVYEVEIQKKFALSAACIVMALLGIAIASSVRRGGIPLVVVGSVAVFMTYYFLIMTGESLAERMVVSPVVGMWGANALLLGLGVLALRRVARPASA